MVVVFVAVVPALKGLFEVEELVEIETSRNGEKAGLWDAVLVDDLDGGHCVMFSTEIDAYFMR